MQPNASKEIIDDDLTCNGLAYPLGCHRLKTIPLEGEHETSVIFLSLVDKTVKQSIYKTKTKITTNKTSSFTTTKNKIKIKTRK